MHQYFTAAGISAAFFFSPVLSVVLSFLLTACNRDPQPRRYTEIAFQAKGNAMAGEASLQITWTLPAGWIEQPKGDPLRLASFLIPDSTLADADAMNPKEIDVSIIQLAGDAGGVSANISRWLGQLKIPPSPEVVEGIVAQADSLSLHSGQKGISVDLTGLLAGDMTRSTSIIGFILPGNGYTVFVKAMGDRDRLTSFKSQILGFSQSLSIEEEGKKEEKK